MKYIKIMRPKHWLKNVLVVVPLFFDLNILNYGLLANAVLGFFTFSIISSIVYIINDMNDLENDRNSSTKRKRPLASGEMSIREAIGLLCAISAAEILMLYLLKFKGAYWILLYLVLNILYSKKLKHVPILDVLILASGFLLRLLYGASVTDIQVSFWLCMTVISLSFYMGLGKRRNELISAGDDAHEIRAVLKYYNNSFLDKNMYMCLGLGITFYALWSGAEETVCKLGTSAQMWTVPIVIVLAMRYSLDLESNESGDPLEIITGDRWLMVIGGLYCLIMFIILYF